MNNTYPNDLIANAGPVAILDLDQAIRERHSTRMFLPRPVPRDLLDEALALAQLAPSNSNIQPRHVVFVSGPPRDRLVAAMLDEARLGPPTGAALPEAFEHFRRELGAQIYPAMGVARDDKAGHTAAILRNWEFFRAPMAGHRLHEPGTRSGGRSQCGDVSANAPLGIDRTRPGFLRRGLGHGVPRDHPCPAGDPDGAFDSVRASNRLSGLGLPRQ
jgi:hypothetical protein